MPICGAARPTPLAAYIDSNMSSSNLCSSGVSNSVTSSASRLEHRIAVFHNRINHTSEVLHLFEVAVVIALASRASESPPNFSRNACASTIATIASPITPAAGTTHTSLRS